MKKRMLPAMAVLALLSPLTVAADLEVLRLEIREHQFIPEIIEVKAGQKFRIEIINHDPAPEEFESFDLNREKMILGGKKATVFLGPLKPGKYEFFGEFNMKSARGAVVAR